MTKGQKRTELILYAVLWTALFAAPVVSMLVGDFFVHPSGTIPSTNVSQPTLAVEWESVWNAWSLLAMFFVTFCIHNFLIAPLLVYHNRKWAYGSSMLVLFACFMAYQTLGRPHPKPMERREPRPTMSMGSHHPAPPEKPWMTKRDEPNKLDGPNKPNGPNKPDEPSKGKHEPPHVFGGQDSVAFIIMTLLLGLNVCTKYFFKSQDDRKKLKELERENLNRQLEYLKYQINPHFFMNTLNNIHALVDIAPEQAKYTIEVLSKLMRYVLYEGNKTMAPLQKEIDFIGHYVDLMRIRYTDKVRISLSLPSDTMNIQVPSLLFTTFVENAFKHGVSYQRESFIEVGVRVDEAANEIAFSCNNSRKPEADDKHGGVGLRNAKKRLQLIYGEDYALHVEEGEEEYRLLLRIPIRS